MGLELEPHRIGPARFEAETLQLPAAAAAAVRIQGVLEHAIEETIRADPGVAAAGGEPGGELGGELEGAFGQKGDAQRTGTWVPTPPSGPAPHAALGRVENLRFEGSPQPPADVLDVHANSPQGIGRIGGGLD